MCWVGLVRVAVQRGLALKGITVDNVPELTSGALGGWALATRGPVNP